MPEVPQITAVSVLFLRYISGDMQAFQALWHDLVPQLRRFIRARYAQQFGIDWCEDIVQTAMLKAHTHRHKLILDTSLDTLLSADGELARFNNTVYKWYIQICRNHALDCLRKNKSEMKALKGKYHEPTPEPEYDAKREKRFEQLAAYIEALPPAQQRIVKLHAYDDLSMAEIAQQEGVKEGAIRTRASRAYAALREMFRQHEEEEMAWDKN